MALTKRGKSAKILAILDRQGLPLSVGMHAANHHEVTLVLLTFKSYLLEATPDYPMGDPACDSDRIDAASQDKGIEAIAPHRSHRPPRTHDRPQPQPHQRRWIAERSLPRASHCPSGPLEIGRPGRPPCRPRPAWSRRGQSRWDLSVLCTTPSKGDNQ